MFLVLVNILVVLVARENAASLGAPAAIRLFHTRRPMINSTAQQTEAVPVTLSPFQELQKTVRKVSVHVPKQIFPKSFHDEENQVTIPQHQTVQHNLQNNDSEEQSSLEDTNDTTTERTASTVYDFQSSTTKEQRSLEELLKLARIKYLGHDLSGKPTSPRTVEKRKPKSRVRLSNRRKLIIETNKQRHGLIHGGFGSSRLRLSGVKVPGTGISQTQKPISTMNIDESYTIEISTSAKVQEAKELKIDLASNNGKITPKMDEPKTAMYTSTARPETGVTIQSTISSDGSIFETSRTELDNTDQTTIPTTSDDLSSLSLDISKHVSTSPEDSPMRKRMTKITDTFQLMSSDEAQSVINIHQGRSLMHRPGHLIANIQNIYDASKETTYKKAHRVATAPSRVQIKEELLFSDTKNDSSQVSTSESESDSSGENDSTEGSADDWMEIFNGQYHEIDPGQYHETNPGQYHEVNPGQYHEANPGQYHETDPGQYYEINPGQEVQLNIEFNPEEETKTYNVHKKTGDYIIGEVGKINVNNGQTLEGVRYTAVDGMVDQAQIAEILQSFFGTQTN